MKTFLALVYAFSHAVKFFLVVKKRLDEGETIKQIRESRDEIDKAFSSDNIEDATRKLNAMWLRVDSKREAESGVGTDSEREDEN